MLISEFAQLSGVSTRLLRYYDQVGLLTSTKNASGYRLYTPDQTDRLNQILFYKELGFDLETIQSLLVSREPSDLLSERQATLSQEITQRQHALQTTTNVAYANKTHGELPNKQKYRVLRNTQQQRQRYTSESSANYGETTVMRSFSRLERLSNMEADRMTHLEQQILACLYDFVTTHAAVSSLLGKQIYYYHKEWLAFTITDMTPSIHGQIASLYTTDARFLDYYSERGVSLSAALTAIISYFTEAAD